MISCNKILVVWTIIYGFSLEFRVQSAFQPRIYQNAVAATAAVITSAVDTFITSAKTILKDSFKFVRDFNTLHSRSYTRRLKLVRQMSKIIQLIIYCKSELDAQTIKQNLFAQHSNNGEKMNEIRLRVRDRYRWAKWIETWYSERIAFIQYQFYSWIRVI